MEKVGTNPGMATPELMKGVLELDSLVSEILKSVGISEGFSHLLRLHASHLKQCPACMRHHARDALSSGETPDRIRALSTWRESRCFTEKERAALRLIESVTFFADGRVPQSVYADAGAVLSTSEIAAVEWLGAIINASKRAAMGRSGCRCAGQTRGRRQRLLS